MSYDLYLSSPQLSHDAFIRYFEGRPNYRAPGHYMNEDTGVYFSFHFGEAGVGGGEAPEVLRGAHAAFNLNYFRPHVFGLEAEPELTAFVEAFSCAIHDPQNRGMGEGPYSPDGFLSGWNLGNRFGYGAIGASGVGDDTLIVDDHAIERVWRCNHERRALQAQLGEAHFAPLIVWARRADTGEPIAFSVWGEGVATAFPDAATHALLARKPRAAALFGARRKGLEGKLMSIAEVAALDGCAWTNGPPRALLAPSVAPPSRAVRAAFSGGFRTMNEVMTAFAPDHVLNASLMSNAAGGRA